MNSIVADQGYLPKSEWLKSEVKSTPETWINGLMSIAAGSRAAGVLTTGWLTPKLWKLLKLTHPLRSRYQ